MIYQNIFSGEADVVYKSCAETHKYICEYKGGPSCPDGMFSVLGKCLGFVRNVLDDNEAKSENCYFQSGSKHTYRLAELEDVQVYLIISQ